MFGPYRRFTGYAFVFRFWFVNFSRNRQFGSVRFKKWGLVGRYFLPFPMSPFAWACLLTFPRFPLADVAIDFVHLQYASVVWYELPINASSAANAQRSVWTRQAFNIEPSSHINEDTRIVDGWRLQHLWGFSDIHHCSVCIHCIYLVCLYVMWYFLSFSPPPVATFFFLQHSE